jgi:hypothetical protein
MAEQNDDRMTLRGGPGGPDVTDGAGKRIRVIGVRGNLAGRRVHAEEDAKVARGMSGGGRCAR